MTPRPSTDNPALAAPRRERPRVGNTSIDYSCQHCGEAFTARGVPDACPGCHVANAHPGSRVAFVPATCTWCDQPMQHGRGGALIHRCERDFQRCRAIRDVFVRSLSQLPSPASPSVDPHAPAGDGHCDTPTFAA